MRRLLLLVPLVAAFVVGGIGLFRARPPAELGKPAPSFDLPTVADESERIELSDLTGRPLVLNFWASWCDPCKDEAPEFARVAREMEDDVTFLGVSILDGRGAARDFVKEYGIPFESVRDTRGVIAKRYGVTGAPETVFVDPRGRVVGKYIGAFREDELEPLVRDLLALKPGEFLRITGRGETRPVP